MTIPTKASFSGFIASEPKPTQTSKGEPRMFVKVGKPRFMRNGDGTFTELEATMHNLVAYRGTAQRALAKLAKGDNIVAEGYVHRYSVTRDGHQAEEEEFVATRIGHDLARTRYEVDRTPRHERSLAESKRVTRPSNRTATTPAASLSR